MKELLGKKIGEGKRRIIYEHKENKDLVIKVLKDPNDSHNKYEYLNWVNTKFDLLAPCLSISQDGIYLVQQKGEQTDEIPPHVPEWFWCQSDWYLPRRQWVKIDGKLKSCDYGFNLIDNLIDKMIPKRIFTIWLNDNPEIPEIVKECIATHKIEGYEHRMITLDNCFRDEFVEEKIKAKEWVMAADYLRIHYLYEEGGIYLDADTKVLKPFDDLLGNKAFACIESNGFVANSVIGFQKGDLLLRQYLDISNIVIKNEEYNNGTRFLGMKLFSLLVYLKDYIKLYPSEYFLPYNHDTDIINITSNTYTYHYYLKSWKK